MSDHFSALLHVFLSPCCFSAVVKPTPCVVVHDSDPALQDLLWTRQAPDWDGTGTGILWTMAPAHRLPAGHWVVLLETPVLSTTCQDELLHAPPADAGLGQGTRRRPGHLKKSVLTFSGTLKIFTVWRLNFSPENCPEWPGRRALSPDIYWVWPEIAKLELCWAD